MACMLFVVQDTFGRAQTLRWGRVCLTQISVFSSWFSHGLGESQAILREAGRVFPTIFSVFKLSMVFLHDSGKNLAKNVLTPNFLSAVAASWL